MKVDRLVSIIMILLDKERVSAQELSDKFEVSPRTIYRDIAAINLAGIPIRATSGVGGGFEIMEKYKVNNKVFSTNDLSTILIGLSSISNMVHGITAETFAPRAYQKPQLDIADLVETMQTNVKIRIHRSVMDRVLDYCTYDQLTPDGDDYYIVTFPFIENDYYYDILFSFGTRCECLEPAHIREEMKKRIQAVARLYQ